MTRRLLILTALTVLVGLTCTPGVVKFSSENVKQVIAFDDEVYFHNVGITWDGKDYYTLNGGNEEHGKVNVYDRKGKLKSSEEPEVDGRAIFYNPGDMTIYVKGYSTNLMTYEPELGVVLDDEEDVFHSDQSSPALAPDGKTIYELAEGTLYIMDFPSMDVRKSIEDFSSLEMPYNSTIAASRDYLFTWNAEGKVKVYDLDGNYLANFQLRKGLHGMSLTWCNGLLWGAVDADGKAEGAVGTWHGYNLGPGIK
jgi:hypothetical protein